jgi:hypothetical protein
VVHQKKNMANVNIYRTLLNAAAAAHTGHAAVIFINEIFELVHKTLPEPLMFLRTGIVPRAMEGEKWEHTGIPVAKPDPVGLAYFVLDIEAPAGGTDKGADAAIDAGKLHLLPEVGVK